MVGLGVLALGGCGLLVLGAVFETTITHDLVDANFTSTAEPFPVGRHGQYAFSFHGGNYRITSTEDPDSPGTAFGNYERVAYNVDTSMEVVRVDGERSTVTLGCFNEDDQGYELVVGPEGAALAYVDGNDGTELDATDNVGVPTWPTTMSISCSEAFNSDDVTVTGYLDGRSILRATDRSGTSDWAYATVGYLPDGSNQTLLVDDVVAHVPGE